MSEQTCQASIVRALRQGQGFARAHDNVEVIETHISWVFLVGDYAYKMKKAIRLNFLDFTGLDRRLRFCEDELRLNRRSAPELYLDVVPVVGDCERPIVGGEGNAIEYLLRMQRFPQSARLDNQLESDNLGVDDMLALAQTVGSLHLDAEPVAFTGADDALHRVSKPIHDNYPHIERVAAGDDLNRVQDWTERELERVTPTLVDRQRAGFVRVCHGDLHLANLVRLEERIAAFDCIEFSAELREIDVISDTSFLVMDLASRGRADLGYVFLNRYLELTGDYDGLCLLDLYIIYHCMIRAKVAAIRHTERSDEAGRDEDIAEVRRYMQLALRWIDRPRPVLVAMHGFSGSGKSWLSAQLVPLLPAVRLRTDTERKRQLGLAEQASTGSGVDEGVYTKEARLAVYERLLDTTARLLAGGRSVILDASLLRREFRDNIRELADKAGVSLVIVSATASAAELDRRLRDREREGDDASEADRSVLASQKASADPLDTDELARTVQVATDHDVDLTSLVARIRELT